MRAVAQDNAALEVTEIARTVCELLEWKRPNGGLKNHECRQLLERLAAEGVLTLPALRRLGGRGQIQHDWQTQYGHRPLLLETLVDANRFQGTCYRAANWIAVGQTTGRGRMDREHHKHGQAIKNIYVYPLVRDARQRLCGDPTQQGAWR